MALIHDSPSTTMIHSRLHPILVSCEFLTNILLIDIPNYFKLISNFIDMVYVLTSNYLFDTHDTIET
jgi:hypothetical protein